MLAEEAKGDECIYEHFTAPRFHYFTRKYVIKGKCYVCLV